MVIEGGRKKKGRKQKKVAERSRKHKVGESRKRQKEAEDGKHQKSK